MPLACLRWHVATKSSTTGLSFVLLTHMHAFLPFGVVNDFLRNMPSVRSLPTVSSGELKNRLRNMCPAVRYRSIVQCGIGVLADGYAGIVPAELRYNLYNENYAISRPPIPDHTQPDLSNRELQVW